MFEEIYADSNKSNSKKKNKQLQFLLSRYIELEKFQDISNDARLTTEQKSLLKKRRNKRKILQGIHEDRIKRYKPEESYETWHTSNTARDDEHHDDFLPNALNEIENNRPSDDENYENDNGEIDDKIKKFNSSFDISSNWTKAHFLIRTKGLEVLPIENYENAPNQRVNVMKQHLDNLKMLLHLNVLSRKWDLAYKVFCLLVRIPKVDIRTIWPIGIEILSKRSQEIDTNELSSLLIFKEEKFFDWLSSFFITRRTTSNSRTYREISAPAWRSGSKSHTPLYVISSLWELMFEKKFSKLKSKLEELLLEPPYNCDGVFYYLMALCELSESIVLTDKFHSENQSFGASLTDAIGNYNDGRTESPLHNQILEHIKTMEKNLDKCKTFQFYYPVEPLNKEVNRIFEVLNVKRANSFHDSAEESDDPDSYGNATFPLNLPEETESPNDDDNVDEFPDDDGIERESSDEINAKDSNDSLWIGANAYDPSNEDNEDQSNKLDFEFDFE
ncbi:uncharacterized protein PRCAT00002191001 [Priceomyces carsonii]|uniref:uncharacterized protein n=1 Tax=Priceomyces carsonii TaxID=28549 RepID=UPI002EDA68D5|nr:unnamed protein product [Priceomyces carsonii]